MKRKIKENKGKIKQVSILILLIFGLMQFVCGEEFEEHFDPNSGSSGDYYLGENDSIITIYEYANWYGTWCVNFWLNTFPQLNENYVDTGIVKFIFRDWVWLSETGKMGEAVECAGDQGKYYGYGDYLYHHLTTSTNTLKAYASNLGLNRTQFDVCLDSSKYYSEVWNDKQHSVSGGTPSFFIQCRSSTRTINGPYSNNYAYLDSVIEELLNQENITPAKDNMHINSDTTLYSHTYKIKDSGSEGVIIVNSNNIVFDCNGSTLRGGGSGYGIYVKGFNNVTIKNCVIENYSYGIYLFNSSGNVLTNNTIGSNGMAGVYLIADSNFNNISGNKILNNNNGIYFTHAGDCGFFEGNSNNTLTGNEISNNVIGIYSQNSSSTINSNIACNNTNFDFNSPDWLTSSGDNNTCGTVSGWKDNGIENSCTFRCNGTKCDYDGDYYVKPMCGGTDCDDTNSSINPIAEETYYNGVDDDCNSSTNDCDQDGDGFNATFNVSLGICTGNDCNDSNSNIHPGATEFCNKIDDNCNDIIDDNPVCLCDLNNDGLIIRDYNDLMTAYKCFLGVQKDCEISYLNWSAVRNEYNCFAGNFY